MDAGMQFGEVEEAGREVRLRPDQNRHYAVMPVHDPNAEDLPVFVDIDVMRDMETHALTDKTVELGGVMLGGQYEDNEGNPFVVVTDSLRAEHYEATKGSFKFTHETWQQISRQREEFPEDLQMVGWYHTHPDWGVFLSGMDMFICENFFNRPLDLALVIDPCSGDRGWFHWTDGSKERIRRTGGFYLIGSRFRAAELEQFASQLKGKLDMAVDYRNSGIAGSVGAQPSPVVHLNDSRGSTLGLGILGLICVQFLFLVLIAWKLLFNAAEPSQLSELNTKLEALAGAEAAEQKVAVLERAIQLSGTGQVELARLLEENDALRIQLEDSTANRIVLAGKAKKLERENRTVQSDLEEVTQKYKKTRADLRASNSEIEKLKKTADGEAVPFWKDWKAIMLLIGCGVLAAAGGGVLGFMWGRMQPVDEEEQPLDEPFEIRGEESGKDPDSEDESQTSRPSGSPDSES